MEAYPHDRRMPLSTRSRLDDLHSQISTPAMVPRHAAAITRANTTSASNAYDAVHHRRPRLGARRYQEMTPAIMINDESKNRSDARESLKFNGIRHDQDEEISKQKQEIERLERELERHMNTIREEKTTAQRESGISNILNDNERHYEDEMIEQPMRQQRLWGTRRNEGERKEHSQWDQYMFENKIRRQPKKGSSK